LIAHPTAALPGATGLFTNKANPDKHGDPGLDNPPTPPSGPATDHMPSLVTRALQSYWRLSRPLTMGAQGCILTEDDRVLLIRHTYRPGWHFPGGGVEKNETIMTALRREIDEEAGIRLEARPELFGIYANFEAFPSDHVALFLIRRWSQPVPPSPNREISQHGFFSRDDLPEDTHPAPRRRLAEIFDSAEKSDQW